jgi:hypothetical protein
MTGLNSTEVFEKLIKYGLFPEKLSKIFTSENFGTYAISEGINQYKEKSFSEIKFRVTRNNNAPRILNIPHIIPYFMLCKQIEENWDHISNSFGDFDDYQNRSMIIPQPNNLNKRLVSMLSYERRKDEKFLILDKSFEAKFFVHADIASCYPSIYSHSIPWALVGKISAKENSKDDNLWYNQLDKRIRYLQRNETIGVPIGPDTSSIINEIILSQIDKKLEKFNFFRFIDDYKCYCKSIQEVDEFLTILSRELEYYNLRLNDKKTQIENLPRPFDEDWIRELKLFFNNNLKEEKLSNKHINIVAQFFDLTITLNNKFPNDSAIRYAVKLLCNKSFIENDLYAFVILRLSRICFQFPYFIDLFDDIFETNPITSKLKESITIEINSLIYEHSKYNRSDVALWGLYLAIKYNFEIKNFDDYSDQLINNRDCLPVLLCYLYAKKNTLNVKKFINNISDLISEKLEDEWWLYIFTLYSDNKNKPAFKNISYKDFYNKLVERKISFLNSSLVSKPKIAHNKIIATDILPF